MNIHESGENYLETILLLEKKLGVVRSIDIAREMGFSKPSISRAMTILKEGGFVTIDDRNFIFLTDEGKKVAHSVYERHFFLTSFLVTIGVPHDIAEKDACRMEHVLSPETFEKLKQFSLERENEK
jgi:Mn-dependent transcriptional regulator